MPTKKKKIGLFFGSFNPIHNAHLFVAQEALEHCKLDQVWFVVSPENPDKTGKGILEEFEHRVSMTKLATASNPNFVVDEREKFLGTPSYTYKTLESFRADTPNVSFYLIVGSDTLLNIPSWKKSKDIISNHEFIAYGRKTDGIKHINDAVDEKTTYLRNTPLLEISSTEIRKRIKAEKSIQYLLPDQVINYIKKHNLFQK